MKALMWFAGVGGVLGAVTAVIAHFMSRTVPSVFYVGTSQFGSRVETSLGTRLVHPGWLPVLPVATAIGIVVGMAAGLIARTLGLSIVKK